MFISIVSLCFQERMSECVCACTVQSQHVPSPGVCVGGPDHPLSGALRPLWLCWRLAMWRAHERVRRVPLGAVRQVPGPQGGGRTEMRIGNRKQRRSALCPQWLTEQGRRPGPSHLWQREPSFIIIFANQKTWSYSLRLSNSTQLSI